MGFLKDIKEIKETLNKVTGEALNKSIKYDELINRIEKVKINVQKVSLSYNQDGTYNVKVDYSIPNILLSFDSDGNIIQNERFTAMNMLNLISIEDMMKISACIENAKKKNGN